MKHDPYFKYLAAFILAGVILAFVDPTPTVAQLEPSHRVAANAVPAQPARS